MVLPKSSGGVSCATWDNLIDFLNEGRFAWWPDWIVSTDGTYYYGIDGVTGIIDYGGPSNNGGVSGTDASAVIQACVNAVVFPNRVVGIRAGVYDLGTTQVDATGANLIGMGQQRTQFQYSGAGYAIIYDGSAAQQQYYTVGGFTIRLMDATPDGCISFTDSIFYFNVYDIYSFAFSGGSQTGVLLDADATGVYWNTFTNMRSNNCLVGIHLTGTLEKANANTFISPIMRDVDTGGYGIHIEHGRTARIIAPHIEGTNAFTGIYIEDDFNTIIDYTSELPHAGSTTIEFTATADENRVTAGRMNTAGTRVTDAGTDNALLWVTRYNPQAAATPAVGASPVTFGPYNYLAYVEVVGNVTGLTVRGQATAIAGGVGFEGAWVLHPDDTIVITYPAGAPTVTVWPL